MQESPSFNNELADSVSEKPVRRSDGRWERWVSLDRVDLTPEELALLPGQNERDILLNLLAIHRQVLTDFSQATGVRIPVYEITEDEQGIKVIAENIDGETFSSDYSASDTITGWKAFANQPSPGAAEAFAALVPAAEEWLAAQKRQGNWVLDEIAHPGNYVFADDGLTWIDLDPVISLPSLSLAHYHTQQKEIEALSHVA